MKMKGKYIQVNAEYYAKLKVIADKEGLKPRDIVRRFLNEGVDTLGGFLRYAPAVNLTSGC